jgi:rRNA-processing protein FCF1
MPRKRLVILDSNMLIYIVSGLVTVEEIVEAAGGPGAELLTTSSVIEELRRLSEGRGLTARRARAALELVERLGVKVVETPERDADDSLEALAARERFGGSEVYVATSDRELRRRLRMRGIPTIYYRESRGGAEAEWEPL